MKKTLRRFFEIDVLPFVLFADYGPGMDCFFRMHIQKIELVAKLLLLLFDARCLVMEYHRDQIEFGVRPYVFQIVVNIPSQTRFCS